MHCRILIVPLPGWLTGLIADRTLQDGFDCGSQLYSCQDFLILFLAALDIKKKFTFYQSNL